MARLRRRLAREHRLRCDAEGVADKALARLQEVDRLKAVFLSSVSHELRTPLTSIAGFTSLLLHHGDTVGEEERQDMLQRIERNTQLLLTLIEDLLELSTIERGSPRLALAPIALHQVVDDIVGQFAAEHPEHHIRLAADADVVAVADERAFTRILTNLLTNAVQYAPAATTITVSVSAGGGRCTILVDDQGPGVPADEHDLVFERFYRGSSPAVVTSHGTGIGLSVVRSLAEAMDGSASVHESPGGGARFAVSLPADPR